MDFKEFWEEVKRKRTQPKSEAFESMAESIAETAWHAAQAAQLERMKAIGREYRTKMEAAHKDPNPLARPEAALYATKLIHLVAVIQALEGE